ncbi:hypothetical protein [Streptomyces sp. MUM 178J]|uniref:hypothetical protein n=1 Tax=Streptomyces sp. MUM 178J TaxID=2791991 RepID=UPI001F03F186|nr:hypothetical protein [Streptomyces sp. MUM 178J]WRQ82945.1 hypothetical protein I3F59_028345 [Streptomyces sp. MUM 178J]
MAQHAPARTRTCPDCDGFPVVAIDTGALLADGTRATLNVTCRNCRGTGHTSAPAPAIASHRGHA